ncbi:hypothetical protein ACFLWX_03360 [Chloroflexota bacterium]
MRMKVKLLCLLTAVVLLAGLMVLPAQAATEDEIEESVTKGVAWLVGQQDLGDGSWGDWDEVAHTGFAVVKLEDRARELGLDPFGEEYEYSENVIAGLNFIFLNANETECGWQFGWGTYETGIAMMAIAAGGDMDRVVGVGPHTGSTYGAVLEANVAYLANTQVDVGGTSDGGWSYACNEDWPDNSNSGYAVLGLRYAEAAGIGIPGIVKERLNNWIDYIQNDVDGDLDDGGSGYSHPEDGWVNLLKTGNLLSQMEFVGDTVATGRVTDAIDYIERHWNDANLDPGWKGSGGPPPYPHLQAAYCLMKGLEAFNIQELDVGGLMDWFDEMSSAIIAVQEDDGYWPTDVWAWDDPILATEWALLTLERVIPPLEVEIDIKPGSYPNSINLGKKGVTPVAILTTSTADGNSVDFDATMVDPETVVFAGASPLRWSIEDVDYDGDMDMSLKFMTSELDIGCDDTEARLDAMTYEGKEVYGIDSVRPICK